MRRSDLPVVVPSRVTFPHDIDDFVARFAASAVPKSDWTHDAHLAVGLWHVATHGPREALRLLRDRIRQLNEFHGTVNSDVSGYHETITCVYVRLLHEFLMETTPDLPLRAKVDCLLSTPLAERDALLAFYSRERLMSTAARRDWLEPDVRPIALRSLERDASPPHLSPALL